MCSGVFACSYVYVHQLGAFVGLTSTASLERRARCCSDDFGTELLYLVQQHRLLPLQHFYVPFLLALDAFHLCHRQRQGLRVTALVDQACEFLQAVPHLCKNHMSTFITLSEKMNINEKKTWKGAARVNGINWTEAPHLCCYLVSFARWICP